ncbi:hypothetical protein [uncultured Jannaschia sp.]|uniref:hypothetical protein n=1 Tax=uncultured Jannaschia sp. TaxID=293347 RepID=UPI00260E7D23|nr:hypothetical protein [uncultured Jannaschia sp.]
MRYLSARGIRAAWEPGSGHLPELVIDGADTLWSAPWRDDPAIQSDASIPVVERRLGGTFVCLPFGRDDRAGGPIHGAVANAPWQIRRASPSALTATCATPYGRVAATIAVRDNHPVLYQTHILDLAAPASFAHHPIVHCAAGGQLSAPPPRAVLTFDAEAPVFARNARSDGWEIGGRDLREIPRETCEDFATIVARPGLGWTGLARHAEGDTILSLRRTEQLPVTNVWMSSGARSHAPWYGQRGLVGIEDAISAGAESFTVARAGTSRIAAEGVPTCLPPGRHVIPHAIVRIAGSHEILEIVSDGDALAITTATRTLRIPFDGRHLA